MTTTAVRRGLTAILLVGAGVAWGVAVPLIAMAVGGVAVLWIVTVLVAVGAVVTSYREPRLAAFSATFVGISLAVASLLSMTLTLQSVD